MFFRNYNCLICFFIIIFFFSNCTTLNSERLIERNVITLKEYLSNYQNNESAKHNSFQNENFRPKKYFTTSFNNYYLILFTTFFLLSLTFFELLNHESVLSTKNIINNTLIKSNSTDLLLMEILKNNNTKNQTDVFYNNHGYKYVFQDDTHKIAYCFIPKNACTMFKNLFLALRNNDSNISNLDFKDKKREAAQIMFIHFNPRFNNRLIKKKSIYKKILVNPSWIKFVVVRDPLERLVSGFLDKCIKHPFWCEGNKTQNFTVFAERILEAKQNNIITIDHYWPQIKYCDLEHTLKYYYIIKYNRYNIANNTLKFLKQFNLTQFYYKWGKYHNQTMFDIKTHITFKDIKGTEFNSKIEFYKRFYSKELAYKCIELYIEDYILLNISIPHWVNYL